MAGVEDGIQNPVRSLDTTAQSPAGAETTLSDRYHKEERLHRLKQQKLVELKSEKTRCMQTAESTEQLKSSVTELEDKLLEISAEKMTQSLVINRLQMRPVLEDIFQNDPSIPLSTNQRIIQDLVSKQNELCTAILEELKVKSTMSHTLDKLRSKNQEQEIFQRHLKHSLDKVRQAKKELNNPRITSDTVKRYREDIQETLTQIILVRNIFQGLILGSGLHWAEDPELTETLINLGDSIDNQLTHYSST